MFSASRVTVESAFFGNNVESVTNLKDAYKMAYHSQGTVVIDQEVFQPDKIGLDEGAKILMFNDGETTGRFAGARVILGEVGVSEPKFAAILREAVYGIRYRKMYHGEAYIGLDPDFMVKAHLLVPENFENILYNWLLNFQYMTDEYNQMYGESKKIGDEADIMVLSDPDWKHESFPNGLAYFDPKHNCAVLLGLRYFGEHKKGTLTIAWGIANRNGYASCHGGLKKIITKEKETHVMGVFGLSGSGKSTLTHAKHEGKYDVTVLHDDAYIISTENGSTVALEPSYFDKTQDYPIDAPANKYLITVQNCGVCLDENGKKVLITEDVRNGNGRAIKSKLWAANRVDKMEDPINSVVWLMKDASLPPVLKINDPVLAAVMGANLATKRSTAEKVLEGTDLDALVIEPYANPFRTYALAEDYEKFKYLFEKRGVDNYIINTGHFIEKKIPKEVSIGIIESIVEKKGAFKPWGPFSLIETMDIEGYVGDFKDETYIEMLRKAIRNRLDFLNSRKNYKGGVDCLPEETQIVLEKLLIELSD